jgi:hypothetical protein
MQGGSGSESGSVPLTNGPGKTKKFTDPAPDPNPEHGLKVYWLGDLLEQHLQKVGLF